MKNIFILLFFFSTTMYGQLISTTVTKDLDTLLLNKVGQTKVIKVGYIAYKDSIIRGDTTISSIKKYVPPTTTPPPTTGTTFNLSFTQIPITDPDMIAPGRGPQQWHNSSQRIPYPTESNPVSVENSLDVYYRGQWTQIETGNGVYNWTWFDGLVRDAINKGQKLSFGVMSVTPGSEQNHIMINGFKSSYPAYLHTLMQSETNKDFTVGDLWVPNYNSPNYLARLKALNEAIYNRMLTQTYTATTGPNAGKAVKFFDAIDVIDIRGFGSYGEWHIANDVGYWTNFPSGRVPTAASLIAIIDAHTTAFKRIPLVAMVAAFGGQQLNVFHQYPEVSYYAAVVARNEWGPIGWRKDQYGATDNYLGSLLENNNITWNGSAPLKTFILDRWKTSPITGEPPSWAVDGPDLLRQVNTYHTTSFGNGNFGYYPPNLPPIELRNQIRDAFKKTGYRFVINSGKIVTAPGSLSVTLNWQNIGISPTYENWNVVYELVNSAGTVSWTGTSTFKPKLFLPSTAAITDNFLVPAGTYTLRMAIKDPAGYRGYLPLAIQGKNSDNSINLKTGLTF